MAQIKCLKISSSCCSLANCQIQFHNCSLFPLILASLSLVPPNNMFPYGSMTHNNIPSNTFAKEPLEKKKFKNCKTNPRFSKIHELVSFHGQNLS